MEIFRLPEHEDFYYGVEQLSNANSNYVKFYEFMMFFCTKGSARIMMDLKEYEVREHTLLVIMPGSIVSGVEVSEDFCISLIICSQELFKQAAFRLDVAFFDYLKNNPSFTYDSEREGVVQGFLTSIDMLYKKKDHRYRLPIFRNMMQCFLMDMLDKVSCDAEQNQMVDPANRSESIFRQFIDLVHVNYLEQREVSFYANKLCITPRYLSSVVGRVTGHTPKEFIDEFVILEIKALLESTDLSMQQIASQLHFPDQSFFGRYFKKHVGVMPSRYRTEHR